jgi:eukaryotic-like serine/threonine-protein kinase
VAAGSAPPASGIDATVTPESGAGSQAPVTIRAGAREDYSDLLPIDRRHYVVGEEIARGGMGRILAARDRRLGRPVAIKELLVDSYDLRARFEREARITAKLQHPGIVNILEAGTWPSGEAFYVMKLVTGESLDKVIAARTTLDKRLALLPNVIAAVDALAYAHDHRVIHRDLKPANVLVGDYGETVVIDWGLAKDLDDVTDTPDLGGPFRTQAAAPGATVAGAVMGTPAYMPVEQALGETVDERADRRIRSWRRSSGTRWSRSIAGSRACHRTW